MKHQQIHSDVNSEAPRLVCKHRFKDGRTATFKLWRGRTTIEWQPTPTDEAAKQLLPEYYEWYSTVLGQVLEKLPLFKQVKGAHVVESKLFSENGYIVGYHVEFDSGLRIETKTPHELVYDVVATKDGHEVSHTLNFRWFTEFMQAFVFRLPSR